MVFRGVKSTKKGSPGPVEWFQGELKPTEEGSPGPVQWFSGGVKSAEESCTS